MNKKQKGKCPHNELVAWESTMDTKTGKVTIDSYRCLDCKKPVALKDLPLSRDEGYFEKLFAIQEE